LQHSIRITKILLACKYEQQCTHATLRYDSTLIDKLDTDRHNKISCEKIDHHIGYTFPSCLKVVNLQPYRPIQSRHVTFHVNNVVFQFVF